MRLIISTVTSVIYNKNYVSCLNQNKKKVWIDKGSMLINEFGTFLSVEMTCKRILRK